jgi:hypothetical protein
VHFFAAFIFESYIIDSDFLVDYSSNKDDDDHRKHNLNEEEKWKCYPKRGSNQTPYQKIESQIRKDAHFWPPITPNLPPQTQQTAANLTLPVDRSSSSKNKLQTVNETTRSESNGKIPHAAESGVMVRFKTNNNSAGEFELEELTRF